MKSKELKELNYYAEVTQWNEDGICEAHWGFHVRKEGRDIFTFQLANELIDKRKNLLRIFEDDLPVYENNNGKICRDVCALADSLM